MDDIMSRLATIGDGTNTHASYKYLGAGKIVTEDYEDIDVKPGAMSTLAVDML